MVESSQSQILSLLKIELPGFESKLEQVYREEPVFRQIAREYYECVRKRELDIGTTGDTNDCYADTIKELKEEIQNILKE